MVIFFQHVSDDFIHENPILKYNFFNLLLNPGYQNLTTPRKKKGELKDIFMSKRKKVFSSSTFLARPAAKTFNFLHLA